MVGEYLPERNSVVCQGLLKFCDIGNRRRSKKLLCLTGILRNNEGEDNKEVKEIWKEGRRKRET
jgi:hypothetical protein